MSKAYFGYFCFLSAFGLTYLAYITWLTGYRAGYDEGAAQAWNTARKTLSPSQVDPTDLNLARPRIVPVEHTQVLPDDAPQKR